MPKPAQLKNLKAKLGMTHLITLLGSKKELGGITHIKEDFVDVDVEPRVRWLPVLMDGAPSQGKPPSEDLKLKIKAAIFEVLREAKAGAAPVVFIHCAAGQHRTGFFAHALLLAAGLKAGFCFEDAKRESLEIVREARAITGAEAEKLSQQKRLKLAEDVVAEWSEEELRV